MIATINPYRHTYIDIVGFPGPVILNYAIVDSANYELKRSDYFLHVTTTIVEPCLITIPSDQITARFREISIKDAGNNATVNNILINTEGAELIEFKTGPLKITANGGSYTLYFDGSNVYTK